MDLMDYRRKIIANSPHLSSASGAVVTFADGTDLPLKSMTVNIEPVQSGTGDPSPTNIRPISGWNGVKVTRTGKNLSLINANNVSPRSYWGTNWTELIAVLNTLPVGVYTISNKFTVVTLPNNGQVAHGRIYITAMVNGTQRSITSYSVTNDTSSTVGKVYQESGTFTITEEIRGNINHAYLYCDSTDHSASSTDKGTYTLTDVQIELGSIATPYEPYNGVTIRSGGNLFNPHVYTGIAYNPTVGDTVTLTDSATQFTDNGNGVFTVTTSATWRYFNVIIPIDSTKEYAAKIVFNSTGQAGVTRGYLNADFKILSKFNSTDAAISWEIGITPETNAAYYYFVFTNRGTASATLTLTQPQFVEGATVGDYDPYTDTFYGGTLNPLTGVVTLDRQFFELDGNSNITVYSAGNASATEAYPYYAACYFTCHATENYSAWRFSHGRCVKAAYAGIFRTYVYTTAKVGFVLGADSALSTAAAVKTWLQTQKDNGTPLQIVAELTEPITIQLTPQQIRSLYGNNTIFADTGNVALEYWAHP